jgi:hypothetical protein
LALSLSPLALQAAIVPTNQIETPSQAEMDHAKVQVFLERADVKDRLQALGVEGIAAEQRVAAMDDREIHALAQKIDSLPAGGNLKDLSDLDIIKLLLGVILLVLIL